MLAETAAAMGSLKNLYDVAKGIQALKTDTEIKLATSEMLGSLITVREQVFEAQEAEAALLKRVRDLEDEIARPGTYAYTLKPALAGDEPPQRLCQPCYDQRKKGVLHYAGYSTGNDIHECPSCKRKYLFGGGEMPNAETF
jgi:hypothetical protein